MRLGLEGWIIQDGNYDDFAVGEERPFAFEFWLETPPSLVQGCSPTMVWQHDASYLAEGTVTFVGEEWWVLDAGLRMYSNSQPTPGPAGTLISAKLNIGVDHFAYFEQLALAPGAPPLIYDWCIEAIELDTTPRVETKPRFFERDLTRRSSAAVVRTDVWNDDPPFPEYVMTCSRFGDAPRRCLGVV